MYIDVNSPVISYAKKGVDFQYEKLFCATFSKYIEEYKNARLEALTEPDQAICLSRLVKKMLVNGVPVTEFFAEQRATLSPQLSDVERAKAFCLVIAKDMFACFDPNVTDDNGNRVMPQNIYCMVNDLWKDWMTTPAPTKMQKMMSSKHKDIIESYAHYEELISKCEAGELPTVCK